MILDTRTITTTIITDQLVNGYMPTLEIDGASHSEVPGRGSDFPDPYAFITTESAEPSAVSSDSMGISMFSENIDGVGAFAHGFVMTGSDFWEIQGDVVYAETRGVEGTQWLLDGQEISPSNLPNRNPSELLDIILEQHDTGEIQQGIDVRQIGGGAVAGMVLAQAFDK